MSSKRAIPDDLAKGRGHAVKDVQVDLTYGFPGSLPRARNAGDQQRLFQFFHEIVKGLDIRAAARKAGYSEKWAKFRSYGYVTKHQDFIDWLQAHYSQQVAKRLAIEQQDVLEEMAKIAFANEYDYVVIETQTDGTKVARRKRLHELTRDQMTAIIVYRRPGTGNKVDVWDWKWRDRDGKLFEIAKHLGMMNEKIILEHRHRHLHMAIDLSGVGMKELEALEGQFEVLLGRGDAQK